MAADCMLLLKPVWLSQYIQKTRKVSGPAVCILLPRKMNV